MATSGFFVFSLCLVSLINVSELEQFYPRGVDISIASSYQAAKTFTCLDGKGSIPFEQVNDDYCDCSDGSDEPGTSACPNGRFYCTNKEYKPSIMPSSRVNDGICDCCDGSDEYDGFKTCSNTCWEMGKALREEMDKKKIVIQSGLEAKEEYIRQGEQVKFEKTKRLEELNAEQELLAAEKTRLEEAKNTAEGPEKEAKVRHDEEWNEIKEAREAENEHNRAIDAFADLDANKDKMLTPDEIMTHQEFDTDQDGTVSETEALAHLDENPSVSEVVFVETMWEKIKSVYAAPLPPPPVAGTETEETSLAPGDPDPLPEEEPTMPPPDGAVEGDDDDGDFDDDDDFDSDDDDEDEETESVTPADDLAKPMYPEETQQLITVANTARQAFKEAEEKFNNVASQLKEVESFMGMDFGSNDEYHHLHGQCFEYTDREYVYKLCPFNNVSQRPKHGGSETSLGTWGRWSGPETNIYASQTYEKGQNCWNGPDRSAKIIFICSDTNELISSVEPNRCEYTMDFHTPSACISLVHHLEGHDEL